MTTSNSPPSVAVEAVILARAPVSGTEAVQHGHRADDGELVVVDAERRKRDARFGRGDAEDEQPSPAPDRVEGGFDGGRGAGAVDGDVELLAVQVADVGCGGDRAEG